MKVLRIRFGGQRIRRNADSEVNFSSGLHL